jgi:L-2-hydroxyglutarate oxidase LhgO
MDNVDAVVVGAGVVGLAVARALARTGLEVVILESENAFGTGVSARNSEVIHAGLYYPTHSHKARLCVQGREQLYAFCETYGVHHRRCGKLLVATSEAERSKLDDIARQAFLNGVTDLQPLEAAQARQLEPEVSCVAALWSPSTGIVDSHALMTALLGDAQAHGAQLALLTRVVQARPSSSGWILSTQGTEAFDIATRLWVNCAGLHAVELARSTQGLAATGLPNAHYAKGNYFALRQRSPFQRLVYPMPTDGGLGIHLTLDLGGQARFGPDTQWLPEGTHPSSIDYAVSGNRQAAFYADIRRYWPGLPDDALAPAYTGVRPKLGPPGTSHDFMLLGPQDHGLAGCVHLLGIESPGLTSCLALADEVVRMLKPPPA